MLKTDLLACNNYDGGADAAAVTCPSLVIIAAKDKMTPAKAGNALAAALKGVQHHMIDGAGHFVHCEKSVKQTLFRPFFLEANQE